MVSKKLHSLLVHLEEVPETTNLLCTMNLLQKGPSFLYVFLL